jgi:hypothetical protein
MSVPRLLWTGRDRILWASRSARRRLASFRRAKIGGAQAAERSIFMLRHDEWTAGPIGFDDLGIERMILLCQDRACESKTLTCVVCT